MYDNGKILLGLIVFVVLMTFPVWYNLLGGVGPIEDPVIQTRDIPGKDQCVRPTDYMRTQHMHLLDQWRDEVVRRNERFTKDLYGNRIEKSLTKTCLDCHSNQDTFCDRCHNVMNVSLYCWNCHVTPSEVAETKVAQSTEGKGKN